MVLLGRSSNGNFIDMIEVHPPNAFTQQGDEMSGFNLFNWVREGVKHSVLLGVADAVGELGTPPNHDDLSGRLGEYLRGSGASNELQKVVGDSTQRKPKRLGRTLKDLDTQSASS